ncbi:type VI secretion system baseplate subunit TssG [Photobacterium minamisatsumaniensis]|uniref:type VI secretion system baseplate subunit TssG n=1 Tax=Photobacterium minamisatsumaniensis TaxID=2910233 RepID=UPI003D0C851B
MSVVSRLFTHPQTFDFIQAVRILNTMGGHAGMSLRLESDPMPKGMPTAVTGIEKTNDEIKLRLGLEALSGCKGVIPDYLYAEMLQSLHQDDQALQKFLDVFNQRYYELRASVESAGNLLLRDEKESALEPTMTRLSQKAALASMFALPGRQHGRQDPSILRYGLALSNKSRSLSGLKRLLCDYFLLDISPNVLPSALYQIRPAHQTKIGWYGGQNHQLGQGVVLGSKGDQAFKSLEICITPRTKDEYLNLSKNAHLASTMKQLARTYLRENTEPKLYLYVKREYIDSPVLSYGNSSMRLGEANCLAPQRRSSHFRKILLLPENNI